MASSPATPSERIVPMRVIVCGVHRTGTLSLRDALRQLGIHDCYHMHRLFANPDDASSWARAIEAKYAGRGTFTGADWDRLLGDCQAVCDIPAAFFGAELAETYPEAKVIILNRDPESWYDSVLNSIHTVVIPRTLWDKVVNIYRVLLDSNMHKMVVYIKALRAHAFGYDHSTEKDKALAWYARQYAEFRERIPAERRIEYTIHEGWKPICDFLELPVPTVTDEATGKMVEAPFPWTNDRHAMIKRAHKNKEASIVRANTSLLHAVGQVALMGVAGYAGYLAARTRLGGRL